MDSSFVFDVSLLLTYLLLGMHARCSGMKRASPAVYDHGTISQWKIILNKSHELHKCFRFVWNIIVGPNLVMEMLHCLGMLTLQREHTNYYIILRRKQRKETKL